MITVHLVSKPVAPPWNDATKVIAQGILVNRSACNYRFFGTQASLTLQRPGVQCDVVASSRQFQPSLIDHVNTLRQLLPPSKAADVYHCLFTPNPRTSYALRVALGLRRRPVVHTLCSSPDDWDRVVPLLFADRLVTVSQWAARALRSRGFEQVVHVPPGITVSPPDDDAMEALRHQLQIGKRPVLLFPGDYEFSGAHEALLGALPSVLGVHPDAILVFACRTKTPAALEIEADLRRQVQRDGLTSSLRFLREVADFPALLGLASLLVFPVRSLRRKMDIPLVLLQAMALRCPIIVSNLPSLLELLERPVGVSVPPDDPSALAEAIVSLLKDPSRREAMGVEGRSFVEQRFLATQMAAAYERVYISLADGRAA